MVGWDKGCGGALGLGSCSVAGFGFVFGFRFGSSGLCMPREKDTQNHGQRWSIPLTTLQYNAHRGVVFPLRFALGTPKTTMAVFVDGDGPTRCVVNAGLFATSLIRRSTADVCVAAFATLNARKDITPTCRVRVAVMCVCVCVSE